MKILAKLTLKSSVWKYLGWGGTVASLGGVQLTKLGTLLRIIIRQLG